MVSYFFVHQNLPPPRASLAPVAQRTRTVLEEKRYLANGTMAHRMRRTLHVSGMRLRLAALDEATFLNGLCFYERWPLRTDATSFLAVHNNYIIGDDRKFERARAYHAILDENDKTWEAFARRSRAAMEANTSWSPLDPRKLRRARVNFFVV